MDSKIKLTSKTRLAVQAIGALACWFSVTAHAAEPFAGVNLKMDVALLNPVAEDCEEGDLMLPSLQAKSVAAPAVAAAPATTPAPAQMLASIQAPKAVEPVQLARLTPQVEQLAARPAAAQAQPAPVATEPAKPAPAAWDIVPADKTLNTALARWAAQAGWQLVWELPVDYAVEARTSVPGTFEEAVGTVARSMDTAEIPMKAIFYAGNKVLRIVAKGVE
jgi:hypothetical protein